MTTGKMYSRREVAEMANLTIQTIWTHIKAGKLRAYMVGGRWRVTEKDLREYLLGKSNRK